MSWQIALVISVISVPFFLVFLSQKIEADNWFGEGVKIFLIFIALIGIILSSGLNLHILDASNSSMGNTSYLNLYSSLETHLHYVIWTFLIILLFFMVYFVYFVYMNFFKKGKKCQEELGGDYY